MPVLLEQVQRIELDGDHTQHHDSLTDGTNPPATASIDQVRILTESSLQFAPLDDVCEIGDVNRDGEINFLDISPFIELLSSGGFQCEADINQDGVVTFLDISPFIGLLSGS